MLVTGNFFHILEWKIPNQTDWQNLLALLTVKYDRLYAQIIEEFGPNGVLVVGLFCFFLGLIIIIYVKSVIDTFRSAADVENDGLVTDDMLDISAETFAQLEAEKERLQHHPDF